MTAETKKNTKPQTGQYTPIRTGHSLSIENRAKMSVTGVIDVVSFNDDKVELKTHTGGLVIRGREFDINRLDTDTGEIYLTGEVNSLEYTASKSKGSIFSGLFS